jgi:CCR4-NOT transcription complex subunit 4
MQEVLKANKEKAMAEKRDRERLRAWNGASSGMTLHSTTAGGVMAADGGGATGMAGGSDGDGTMSASRVLQDPPKDRNLLANMRVIRRNLVYAVGFPLSIATEDVLKKPEYLGQYGKLAKIVLNRNHTMGTDSRRASASAYITFVHKVGLFSLATWIPTHLCTYL